MEQAVIDATKEAITTEKIVAALKKVKSTPIKVVGISGSLRKASFHTGLLRYLSSQKLEGMEFEIVSIADLPMFNQDLENLKDESKLPKAVQDFKAKIRAADAFFVACPEYNFGITAPLKNAIDWASRGADSNLWKGKVSTLAGAGGSGAAKAQIQFRQCCVFLQLQVVDMPQVAIPAFAKEEDGKMPFDFGTGDLLSAKWKERVVAQINLLRDETQKKKMGQIAFEMCK